jgi:hypothetical protein
MARLAWKVLNMSRKSAAALFILMLLAAFTCTRAADSSDASQTGISWQKIEVMLEDGMNTAQFYLFQLDPREYEFTLLSISEQQTTPKTAREWCDIYGYEICFNAGMFARDNNRSLGFCKNYDHIINPRLNRHNSVLAFNPKNPEDPPLRIIDRRCENFDSIGNRYNSLLQSIRMLGCGGGNAWNKSDKRHSILALAMDRQNNLLLLYAEQPLAGYDFINLVVAEKPDIKKMMYLEGGAHASLYINTDSLKINLSGLLEGLISMRNIDIDLPQVIAIRKKTLPQPK